MVPMIKHNDNIEADIVLSYRSKSVVASANEHISVDKSKTYLKEKIVQSVPSQMIVPLFCNTELHQLA
jgi:hypothetical protein